MVAPPPPLQGTPPRRGRERKAPEEGARYTPPLRGVGMRAWKKSAPRGVLFFSNFLSGAEIAL